MEKTERNARIAAAYQGGLSMRQVAAEFGVSSVRVSQILKAMGVQSRPSGRDPIEKQCPQCEGVFVGPNKHCSVACATEAQAKRAWTGKRRRIRDLLAEGRSTIDIMRETGATPSCVSRVRARTGHRIARPVPHLRDPRLLAIRAEVVDGLLGRGLSWDEVGRVLGGMDSDELRAWRRRHAARAGAADR